MLRKILSIILSILIVNPTGLLLAQNTNPNTSVNSNYQVFEDVDRSELLKYFMSASWKLSYILERNYFSKAKELPYLDNVPLYLYNTPFAECNSPFKDTESDLLGSLDIDITYLHGALKDVLETKIQREIKIEKDRLEEKALKEEAMKLDSKVFDEWFDQLDEDQQTRVALNLNHVNNEEVREKLRKDRILREFSVDELKTKLNKNTVKNIESKIEKSNINIKLVETPEFLKPKKEQIPFVLVGDQNSQKFCQVKVPAFDSNLKDSTQKYKDDSLKIMFEEYNALDILSRIDARSSISLQEIENYFMWLNHIENYRKLISGLNPGSIQNSSLSLSKNITKVIKDNSDIFAVEQIKQNSNFYEKFQKRINKNKTTYSFVPCKNDSNSDCFIPSDLPVNLLSKYRTVDNFAQTKTPTRTYLLSLLKNSALALSYEKYESDKLLGKISKIEESVCKINDSEILNIEEINEEFNKRRFREVLLSTVHKLYESDFLDKELNEKGIENLIEKYQLNPRKIDSVITFKNVLKEKFYQFITILANEDYTSDVFSLEEIVDEQANKSENTQTNNEEVKYLAINSKFINDTVESAIKDSITKIVADNDIDNPTKKFVVLRNDKNFEDDLNSILNDNSKVLIEKRIKNFNKFEIKKEADSNKKNISASLLSEDTEESKENNLDQKFLSSQVLSQMKDLISLQKGNWLWVGSSEDNKKLEQEKKIVEEIRDLERKIVKASTTEERLSLLKQLAQKKRDYHFRNYAAEYLPPFFYHEGLTHGIPVDLKSANTVEGYQVIKMGLSSIFDSYKESKDAYRNEHFHSFLKKKIAKDFFDNEKESYPVQKLTGIAVKDGKGNIKKNSENKPLVGSIDEEILSNWIIDKIVEVLNIDLSKDKKFLEQRKKTKVREVLSAIRSNKNIDAEKILNIENSENKKNYKDFYKAYEYFKGVNKQDKREDILSEDELRYIANKYLFLDLKEEIDLSYFESSLKNLVEATKDTNIDNIMLNFKKVFSFDIKLSERYNIKSKVEAFDIWVNSLLNIYSNMVIPEAKKFEILTQTLNESFNNSFINSVSWEEGKLKSKLSQSEVKDMLNFTQQFMEGKGIKANDYQKLVSSWDIKIEFYKYFITPVISSFGGGKVYESNEFNSIISNSYLLTRKIEELSKKSDDSYDFIFKTVSKKLLGIYDTNLDIGKLNPRSVLNAYIEDQFLNKEIKDISDNNLDQRIKNALANKTALDIINDLNDLVSVAEEKETSKISSNDSQNTGDVLTLNDSNNKYLKIEVLKLTDEGSLSFRSDLEKQLDDFIIKNKEIVLSQKDSITALRVVLKQIDALSAGPDVYSFNLGNESEISKVYINFLAYLNWNIYRLGEKPDTTKLLGISQSEISYLLKYFVEFLGIDLTNVNGWKNILQERSRPIDWQVMMQVLENSFVTSGTGRVLINPESPNIVEESVHLYNTFLTRGRVEKPFPIIDENEPEDIVFSDNFEEYYSRVQDAGYYINQYSVTNEPVDKVEMVRKAQAYVIWKMNKLEDDSVLNETYKGNPYVLTAIKKINTMRNIYVGFRDRLSRIYNHFYEDKFEFRLSEYGDLNNELQVFIQDIQKQLDIDVTSVVNSKYRMLETDEGRKKNLARTIFNAAHITKSVIDKIYNDNNLSKYAVSVQTGKIISKKIDNNGNVVALKDNTVVDLSVANIMYVLSQQSRVQAFSEYYEGSVKIISQNIEGNLKDICNLINRVDEFSKTPKVVVENGRSKEVDGETLLKEELDLLSKDKFLENLVKIIFSGEWFVAKWDDMWRYFGSEITDRSSLRYSLLKSQVDLYGNTRESLIKLGANKNTLDNMLNIITEKRDSEKQVFETIQLYVTVGMFSLLGVSAGFAGIGWSGLATRLAGAVNLGFALWFSWEIGADIWCTYHWFGAKTQEQADLEAFEKIMYTIVKDSNNSLISNEEAIRQNSKDVRRDIVKKAYGGWSILARIWMIGFTLQIACPVFGSRFKAEVLKNSETLSKGIFKGATTEGKATQDIVRENVVKVLGKDASYENGNYIIKDYTMRKALIKDIDREMIEILSKKDPSLFKRYQKLKSIKHMLEVNGTISEQNLYGMFLLDPRGAVARNKGRILDFVFPLVEYASPYNRALARIEKGVLSSKNGLRWAFLKEANTFNAWFVSDDKILSNIPKDTRVKYITDCAKALKKAELEGKSLEEALKEYLTALRGNKSNDSLSVEDIKNVINYLRKILEKYGYSFADEKIVEYIVTGNISMLRYEVFTNIEYAGRGVLGPLASQWQSDTTRYLPEAIRLEHDVLVDSISHDATRGTLDDPASWYYVDTVSGQKHYLSFLKKIKRSIQGTLTPQQEELIKYTKVVLNKEEYRATIWVAKPGTGKSFTASALAAKDPESVFYQLDLGSFQGGTGLVGSGEEKAEAMFKLFKAFSDNKAAFHNLKPVLVIDEAHTIIDVGASSGVKSTDTWFTAMLKVKLMKDVRVIAITTPEEYAASIARNAALNDRFTVLSLDLTAEDKSMITRSIAKWKSYYHDVIFDSQFVDKVSGLFTGLSEKELGAVNTRLLSELFDFLGSESKTLRLSEESLRALYADGSVKKETIDDIIKAFEKITGNYGEPAKDTINYLRRQINTVETNIKKLKSTENKSGVSYDRLISQEGITHDSIIDQFPELKQALSEQAVYEQQYYAKLTERTKNFLDSVDNLPLTPEAKANFASRFLKVERQSTEKWTANDWTALKDKWERYLSQTSSESEKLTLKNLEQEVAPTMSNEEIMKVLKDFDKVNADFNKYKPIMDKIKPVSETGEAQVEEAVTSAVEESSEKSVEDLLKEATGTIDMFSKFFN